MSESQDDKLEESPEVPSADVPNQPDSPQDDDRTVVQPEQPADPEATVVSLDLVQESIHAAQEAHGDFPPVQDSSLGEQSSAVLSSSDQGTFTTSGTASAFTSGSRSSSWSKPERWLAEAGQRIEVGTILKDRFELLELVGEGGMGMVFRALDRRKVEAQDRNPFLAIKILNEQFKRHPESLKALQREARKAQDLAHPNIVTVFDFDREGSTVYMTMEYLDGESLKEIIKKNPHGVAPERVVAYIEGMCQGLAYAHAKGIVHSDFKPGNVFVTRTGVLKIFDFGIARAAKTKKIGDIDSDDKTMFDAGTLGALTPAYASPEMFLGLDPDPRDDIFALACITYELFSGIHPFNKERADHAQKKGLHPKRLEQLNRLQWKGLSKGLNFDREARTATALHFLREITREKSKLPFIAGLSTVAIMLVLLVFNKQIKNGWNQYTIYSIKTKINTILESETDEKLTVSLMHFRDSEKGNKEIFFKNDFKPIVISTYSHRAKKLVDPEHKKYGYNKAIQLLTAAQGFYEEDPETVQELNRMIDEYKTGQSKLISALRERFETLVNEGKILPTRDQESVFNVMESVALINPGDPLLTDSRLVDAFVREGGNSLEKGELDRAKKFIRTGLEVAESSRQLKELDDKLSIKLREREIRVEIVRLETAIGDQLKAVQTVEDMVPIKDDLEKLQQLQPEHALLAQAAKMGTELLDRELKAALSTHDWRTGDALLKEFASFNLLSREAMQSRYDTLATAREEQEAVVEALFDKANNALADGKPDSALSSISEIKKLIPDDVRLQRLMAKVVQAYLQLAQAAKDEHQWDAARSTIDLALKQDIDETMKQYLLREREDVTFAEENFGRQLQVAEQQKREQAEAQREKQRKEELLSLYDQFDGELKAFEPTEKSVNKVVAILDTIEIKNGGDPFILQGRKKIEQLFLREAASLRDNGSFEQAIKCLKIGSKAFPDFKLLANAIDEYQQKRDLARIQEQKAKLANMYEEADSLIASARMTKEWEAKLQKVMADISSFQVDGRDGRVQGTRRRISALYVNQAQQFRAVQQYTKANEALDKAERFAKGDEAIVTERRLLADDEKAFKEKALEQQRFAEIEGFKQSLRTYAKANEVDQAGKTLSLLKKKLPADDPFLTREAPQVMAIAYLRLAEKKAGARNNRDNLMAAVELAKTGLALDGTSTGLKVALENYKRVIAKLEKAPEPPPAPPAPPVPVSVPATPVPATPATVAVIPKPPASVPPSSPSKPGKPCLPGLAGLGINVRAVCYDMITDQDKGPYMIVIPAGGGNSKPFAIGKYEISFRDYDLYCKSERRKSPKKYEGPDIPVIRVSYQNVQAYAKWLTEKTGNLYRIPKDREWVHAAEAGGKRPVTDYNCFLQQGSMVLKGNSLLSVRTGGANAWGMQNFIGNVQEYVDSSSGIKVRGGAYRDSMSTCGISLVKNHPGVPDELTGFRLVREIKE